MSGASPAMAGRHFSSAISRELRLFLSFQLRSAEE